MSNVNNNMFRMYEQAVKALPFMRITNKSADSMEIRADYKGGKGSMRIFHLFPGVLLSFYDFHTESFPAFSGEIALGLKLNFCCEGRSRLNMKDNMCMILEPDDFYIGSGEVKEGFYFPGGRYYGIELFVYKNEMSSLPEGLLRDMQLDPSVICGRVCGEDGHYINKAPHPIKTLFQSMRDSPKGFELDWLRLKTAELLMLLTAMERLPAANPRCFYTNGQTEIVK